MVRRNLLKTIWHVNEKTDKAILTLTGFYLASLVLTPYYDLSHYVKNILISMHAFVGLLIVLYFLGRFFLKSPNRRWALVMTKKDCQMLGEWLKSGQNSEFLNRRTCKLKYADEGYMEHLAIMNFEAFQGSAYEASVGDYKKRNVGLISRNDKCFMLMIDPIEGREIIGYSCLLPLTESGAQLYLDGSISDAKFPKELIASSSEETFAVLIFAIHLRDEYSFAKCGASRRYALYFWSCIRLHLELVCHDPNENRSAPILYAQTSEKSLERRLERVGFKKTKCLSRDGYYIWEFKFSSGLPASRKERKRLIKRIESEFFDEDKTTKPAVP